MKICTCVEPCKVDRCRVGEFEPMDENVGSDGQKIMNQTIVIIFFVVLYIIFM